MKKTIMLLFITTLLLPALSALDENTFFSAPEKEKVKQGQIISRMYMNTNPGDFNTDLSLNIPRTPYNPDEYSSDKYEVVCDEKAFFPYELTSTSKLKLYNILTGYSRLKGMKYWSLNRDRSETFILDCYRVKKSLFGYSKIDDEKYTSIASHIEGYFEQEDNKFSKYAGKLVYKSDLYNEGNNFILVNSTQSGIPFVCNKDEMKLITFFIYDEEAKGFYYYAFSVMRIRLDVLYKKTNATLFSSRLRAGTIHFATLLGLNWYDKLQAWNYDDLDAGKHKNY